MHLIEKIIQEKKLEKCHGKCLQEHFRESRFENFLGGHAPRPPSSSCPCLATALYCDIKICYHSNLIQGQRYAFEANNSKTIAENTGTGIAIGRRHL